MVMAVSGHIHRVLSSSLQINLCRHSTILAQMESRSDLFIECPTSYSDSLDAFLSA